MELNLQDIKRQGKARFDKYLGMCVLVSLISLVIYYVTGMFGVSIIIVGPIALGEIIFTLNVVRDKDPEVNNLFEGFTNFASAFILCLLVGIKTFLWTLLFIIPGIIKSLSYSMSYYILADNPTMRSSEALSKSVEMMDGHKMELFKLQLSFIGWILLIFVTCGLAAIYVVPYMNCATAEFYNKLCGYTDKKDIEDIIEM